MGPRATPAATAAGAGALAAGVTRPELQSAHRGARDLRLGWWSLYHIRLALPRLGCRSRAVARSMATRLSRGRRLLPPLRLRDLAQLWRAAARARRDRRFPRPQAGADMAAARGDAGLRRGDRDHAARDGAAGGSLPLRAAAAASGDDAGLELVQRAAVERSGLVDQRRMGRLSAHAAGGADPAPTTAADARADRRRGDARCCCSSCCCGHGTAASAIRSPNMGCCAASPNFHAGRCFPNCGGAGGTMR